MNRPAWWRRWSRLPAGAALVALFLMVGGGPATATPTTTPAAKEDPAVVAVGVYIDNIQVVNLESNSFDADISVWLRWTDPDLNPQDSLQIMNLFQSWSLTTITSSEKPERQPDGSYHFLLRYQGSFNTPFSVVDYPFDSQELQVVLQDEKADATSVRFTPDTNPIAIDPTMTLPGYDIGAPRLDFTDYTYPTDFGVVDPGPSESTFSRVVVTIPLTSPVPSGIVKTLLPILLVVATAFLVFFVPVQFVEARVGLVITGLLTLVAMQLGLSNEVPRVTYLLMLDVLYLCAYAFILAAMAEVIFTARQVRLGNTDGAQAVNRRVMLVVGAGYLLASAATLAFYIGR